MTTGQFALDVLISLIPPFVMGLFVWLLMRSILRADGRERDTYAKIEAEERAKRANALGEQP
jgi:hypothetical protein